MLIDTHCHFNNARLIDDIPGCIERARAVGVMQVIVVGYDLESSELAVNQAKEHSGTLFAAIGIHPHDSKDWNDATEQRLRELSAEPEVIAIGEIGLDFFHDFSPRPAQYSAFRDQMRLAREVGLPIIIHCRDAYPETLEVLQQEQASRLGGVMHCWGGTPEQAQATVALGLALGFGGALTFKSADAIRTAARSAEPQSLLVETDAPFLAPVPFRGKRNEPAYTRYVAEMLAQVRDVDPAEIEEITTSNARRIFTRLSPP